MIKPKKYADTLLAQYQKTDVTALKEDPLAWARIVLNAIDSVVAESQLDASKSSDTKAVQQTAAWRRAWLKWRRIVRILKPYECVNEEIFVTFIKQTSPALFYAVAASGCLVGYVFSEDDQAKLDEWIAINKGQHDAVVANAQAAKAELERPRLVVETGYRQRGAA